MISVYDHDAYALVDPGATHSFISVPFTERHQIESQPIDGRMVVSVPNGDTMISERIVLGKDQKISFFGRFFGEKSVFGWVGNDFEKEKSFVKKSAKNRRFFADFPIFPEKTRYFPEKSRYLPKKLIFFEIFDFFPVFSLASKI